MIVVAGNGPGQRENASTSSHGGNVQDGDALSRWPCDAPEPVLAESVDWPVGYAIRHIAERAFCVAFARPVQAVQQCCPLTILVRAEEQDVLRPQQTIRRAFSATFLSVSDPPSLTFLTNQFFGFQQCFRFLLAFCAHRPASHLTPLGGHP